MPARLLLPGLQGEAERGAASPAGLGTDVAAMRLDDRPADRQSHADAIGLGGEELVEHLIDDRTVDTRSGIPDFDFNGVIPDRPRADGDLATRRTGLGHRFDCLHGRIPARRRAGARRQHPETAPGQVFNPDAGASGERFFHQALGHGRAASVARAHEQNLRVRELVDLGPGHHSLAEDLVFPELDADNRRRLAVPARPGVDDHVGSRPEGGNGFFRGQRLRTARHVCAARGHRPARPPDDFPRELERRNAEPDGAARD